MGTVDMISKFDKLFDRLNSSAMNAKKSFNRPFKGSQEQVQFLQEIQFLGQLKIFNRTGKYFPEDALLFLLDKGVINTSLEGILGHQG
nr:unnamed protein product [Callosobruchus analis]